MLAFAEQDQVAVMINNSTTSMEPKAGYTSMAGASRKPASSTLVKSESVSDASPVERKESPASPETAQSVQTDTKALEKEQLEEVKRKVAEAIPKVREIMQKNQRSLDFEVAEKENRVIITVIDKETEKVIRQIPPEDVIQIADAIEQGMTPPSGGLLLDSRA